MEQKVTGIIYVVRVGDYIKIGYTRNLKQRVAGLRHQGSMITPTDIGPVAAVALMFKPGTIGEEVALHRKLARYRIYDTNEWYNSGVLEAVEIETGGFAVIPEPEPVVSDPLRDASGNAVDLRCPHCLGMLTVAAVATLYGRMTNARRKTHSGGRRRNGWPSDADIAAVQAHPAFASDFGPLALPNDNIPALGRTLEPRESPQIEPRPLYRPELKERRFIPIDDL